jgi:hypothetical protein
LMEFPKERFPEDKGNLEAVRREVNSDIFIEAVHSTQNECDEAEKMRRSKWRVRSDAKRRRGDVE